MLPLSGCFWLLHEFVSVVALILAGFSAGVPTSHRSRRCRGGGGACGSAGVAGDGRGCAAEVAAAGAPSIRMHPSSGVAR